MKTYRYHQQPRRWPRMALIVLIVLVGLILLGLVVASRIYNSQLKPVSDDDSAHTVVVESGMAVREIGQMLEGQSLIRAAWAFEWHMRVSDLRDQVQAGSYSLKPNMSTPRIAEIITGGEADDDLITILPVQRLDQIRSMFLNEGFAAETIDAALDSQLYADHPALADLPVGATLEGYLYPESFVRTESTTPQSIIRASLDEMAKHLTAEVRAGIRAQGLSIHQGMILASMLELEVGDDDPGQDLEDKRKVAQVFLSRLNQDMPLQSNPTTQYGAIISGQLEQYRDMAGASYNFPTPYNTYLNSGLPPSPMANISQNALTAVSNPAQTNYLYFFSDDKRQNRFSHTLEEHEQKIAQYCQVNCELPN